MFPLFGKKEAPGPAEESGLKAFLRKDLELTRARWGKALNVFRARPKIDEALYEELEGQLLQADVAIAGGR